jgi:hypothetical protein
LTNASAVLLLIVVTELARSVDRLAAGPPRPAPRPPSPLMLFYRREIV